jgi:hypothetical protein
MDTVSTHTVAASATRLRIPLRPIVYGVLGALGLIAFYLSLITLAQGWNHATAQLAEDRFFIAVLVAGFGTQVGMFTYLRAAHARATSGGVAASTGTSATAMLACCVHHLADLLPVVGLSGAAIFLNAYKTPFLWLGIVMNLAGVAYLLRKVLQQRRMTCH